MAKHPLHNSDEVIEVVIKKKMTARDYYVLLEKMRKEGFKGWSCQGYELGYYQGEKARKEKK
jgi:hypothetical protein